MNGKTATRIIPEALVPETRNQIAEYRRLRDLTSDLVEVNERICESKAEKQETIQKKRRSPLNWLATPPLRWMSCWARALPMAWISKPLKQPSAVRF